VWSFVLDTVALEQVVSEHFGFSYQFIKLRVS
jgi:hypothetical protein